MHINTKYKQLFINKNIYMIIAIISMAAFFQFLSYKPLYANEGKDNQLIKFTMLMNKNNELCGFVEKMFNNKNNKPWYKYDELNWVKWERIRYYLASKSGKRFNKNLMMAIFDIDNDGKKETVVVENRFTVNSIVGDEVYVFKENVPEFKDGMDISFEEHQQFSGFLYSEKTPYTFELPAIDKNEKTGNRIIKLGVSSAKFINFRGRIYLLLKPAYTNDIIAVADLKESAEKINDNDKRRRYKLEFHCYLER